MNRLAVEHRRSLPPRVVSWWLLVVPAVLGTAIGVVVRGDRNFWGDLATLEAIQRINLPAVDALVTFSNLVFSTIGAFVLAILFLGMARLLGRRDLVVQTVIVMVLRLAGQGLKPIFDSPRPEAQYQPDPSLVSSTLGYPSGHAYTATIMASMLIVFVGLLDLPKIIRWTTSVVAVLITAFALIARISVGAHWPSDTIGGVLFGLATIGLMQLIVDRFAVKATDGVWGVAGVSSDHKWRSAERHRRR